MHAERVKVSTSSKRITNRIAIASGVSGTTLLILFLSIEGCTGPKNQVAYNQGEYQHSTRSPESRPCFI
jgi:hypothetical protein